jgi:hypothetical protein
MTHSAASATRAAKAGSVEILGMAMSSANSPRYRARFSWM